jgi:uncharacterized protein YndB with AHSA1/START domain
MSVTSVDTNTDQLTLTLIADFDAPRERVWELWADPRKIERWWGPPGYPATFDQHDLSAGGKVNYYMTSPEGDKYHGYWDVTAADPPSSLEFTDGFADSEGNPASDMPTTESSMTLTEREGGTRMEMRSTFESEEAMQKMVEMGMVEGLREAVGQMDALLAD